MAGKQVSELPRWLGRPFPLPGIVVFYSIDFLDNVDGSIGEISELHDNVDCYET